MTTTARQSPASSRLRQAGPDLWQASTEVCQSGGVRMPANMTVIRLPTGLVVVSPIAIDDELAGEIAALGEVRELVSPNCLHHLFLSAAQVRWPAARLLAPPGLASKRPDLHIDGELPAAIPKRWEGALEVAVIEGAPRLGETVFFHAASGTVLCTDLVFHVTGSVNWRTSLVLWAVGAGGGRLAQSRAWRWFTEDGERSRAAVERILRWPIRRIAVAHGAIYDAPDAHTRLAQALRRMSGSSSSSS